MWLVQSRARPRPPRLADCKHALPGKVQLFQARRKFNRRLGDEAHPFSRRSSGPRGPCARHDVAMRWEEQRGRRGGRWTCSTARAWSEGARFCLTRKSHKYLDVDPRGITQNFQTTNCFSTGSSTCSRCATRFRGRHSEAPARRPRPICSRTTSSTPSRLGRARRRAFDRPLALASLLQKS